MQAVYTKAMSRVRSALLAWYDANARSLAWRAPAGERQDPYRVWLSEIMLQQTTTPHATPYFQRFTARWPTVERLAAAEDAEVMAAWAGLGYYARARNLLACARAVVRVHGGRFPDTEAGLRTLPGVGAYTAAAIAAIAFERPANVVDGNVERVMARLFAVETPLPAAKPELGRLAARLVEAKRAGDWAQALMDLGATVCRPRRPLCDACPIAADCRARAEGAPETYPRRTPKAERPHRHGVAYRLMCGREIGLVQRPPRGLLGGMAGLPTSAWRAAPFSAGEAVASAPAKADWISVGAIEHVFTHFSLSLAVYEAGVGSKSAGFLWTPIDQAAQTLPSLFKKALGLSPPDSP